MSAIRRPASTPVPAANRFTAAEPEPGTKGPAERDRLRDAKDSLSESLREAGLRFLNRSRKP